MGSVTPSSATWEEAGTALDAGVLAAVPELPQPAAPAPRGKKQQKLEPLPPKNAWYFAKTVLAAVLCMAAASGIAPLLFGFLMG